MPSLWQIDLLKIQIVVYQTLGVHSPTGVEYPTLSLIQLFTLDRQKALAVGNAEGAAWKESLDSKLLTREGFSRAFLP